jgi:hypothetical protein
MAWAKPNRLPAGYSQLFYFAGKRLASKVDALVKFAIA